MGVQDGSFKKWNKRNKKPFQKNLLYTERVTSQEPPGLWVATFFRKLFSLPTILS